MQFSQLYTESIAEFLDGKQVLFINQKGISELDDFFQRNLEEVMGLFASYDLEFVYLPALLKPEYLKTLLAYQIPTLSEKQICDMVSLASPQDMYSYFRKESDIHHPGRLTPMEYMMKNVANQTGLVMAVDRDDFPHLDFCLDWEHVYERKPWYYVASIEPGSDGIVWQQIDEFFQQYFPEQYAEKHTPPAHYYTSDAGGTILHNADEPFISDDVEILSNRSSTSERQEKKNDYPPEWHLTDDDIVFEITKCSEIKPVRAADDAFPEEAYKLSDEIMERVEKLRKLGINDLIIQSLFREEVKPSRLLITKDYRLFLPDYNNKEIVMGPLPKAVFLLFLRHPEGILFKRISECRGELLILYRHCSGRELDEEMRQSVNKLVDPLSNSLNEKCSRIREAFLREMDDSIASHYYITGDRATPKRIRLDRKLVEWGK